MKIGDYVRTKYGIAKIGSIGKYKGMDIIATDKQPYGIKEIIKSSPNIIDLIEVGDYVNGNKIIKISNDHCGRTVLVWGFDNGDFQCAFAIYEDDIKSIVTKEQFESMKYEVK